MLLKILIDNHCYQVAGLSMLVSSSLSLLTPAAAEMGFLHLSLVRFLLGFFHGFVYTPIHACWGNWAPPQVDLFFFFRVFQ